MNKKRASTKRMKRSVRKTRKGKKGGAVPDYNMSRYNQQKKYDECEKKGKWACKLSTDCVWKKSFMPTESCWPKP